MSSVRQLRKVDWFHPDGFPLSVQRRNPQEPFGPHTHEFSEIVVIIGGHGWHVTGNDRWPLSAGDVFVISGSRPHHYQDLKDLKLVNILFDPGDLRMGLIDLQGLPGYHALFTVESAWRKRNQFKNRIHLAPRDMSVILGYIDQLENELKNRAPAFGFFATASFMQIIGLLSRRCSQSADPDSRALLRIADTITHLEMNLDHDINLDELARMAHMSRRNFLRAFHAAVGSSPIAYLINLRINRATAMLRRNEHTITEIAFRSGFSDSNYFARQFRKVLGVSPRVYRQQHSQVG